MWTKEILGTDLYHLTAAFVIYSMLGWLLESIYMSLCNRKLTNRGFGKGPFCPIYGFGGTGCYILFHSLKGHYVVLYFLGALTATIFEYCVGILMIKVLGKLWWDYNEKPFNYKGIICLESTIAWGFYALGIIHFVHGAINRFIDRFDFHTGVRLVEVILLIAVVDYFVQLCKVFHVDVREKGARLKDRCHNFIARWY